MKASKASPRLHLFVDNSNVLLEGRRHSEMKRKGRAKRGAFLDESYEIDWGKLLYLIKEKDTRTLAEVRAKQVPESFGKPLPFTRFGHLLAGNPPC